MLFLSHCLWKQAQGPTRWFPRNAAGLGCHTCPDGSQMTARRLTTATTPRPRCPTFMYLGLMLKTGRPRRNPNLDCWVCAHRSRLAFSVGAHRGQQACQPTGVSRWLRFSDGEVVGDCSKAAEIARKRLFSIFDVKRHMKFWSERFYSVDRIVFGYITICLPPCLASDKGVARLQTLGTDLVFVTHITPHFSATWVTVAWWTSTSAL